MRRPILAAGVIAVILSVSATAQRRVASPPGGSSTEIGGKVDEREGYVGGKWIEIKYGRPIKRGRDLFAPPDFAEALNDGAPVWRAGANVSTRLSTEVPLTIGGTRVPPGEYTMFIDLRAKRWMLIISKWAAQTTYDDKNKAALWGTYDYTADKDVVRVPMQLETMSHSFDQLSWEFLDMSDKGGRLAILWDRQMASVPFEIRR